LKSILPVVESLGRALTPKFRDSYLSQLKVIIFDRLQNLTSYDMKDTHMNAMF
jgi:hypothetical protein